MNKSFKAYLYLCIIISCSVLIACSQNKAIKKVKSFNDSQPIKISLQHTQFTSESYKEKINQALQLMNSYLNSKQFKALVLKGPDKLSFISPNESQTNSCNEKSRATFTYNTVKGICFNNEEIYKVIKSAQWNLKFKIKPSSAFFDCKLSWNNSIGALEGDTIFTPECKFKQMSLELLAGFLIHEYLHVIGFRHPYQPSPYRKNTVPYFIGDNAIRSFKNKRIE